MMEVFYSSDIRNQSREQRVGTADDFHAAATMGLDMAREDHEAYDCDTVEDIEIALSSRGYYSLGYGGARIWVKN